MLFGEKIHLLMKMSNTTNAKLANALGIDPSLVSRWRTGSREPSGDSRYFHMIGVYFAAQAKQDFQRVALLEITGHQMEDKNVGETVIAGYLTRWLSNESKISTESIKILLDTIGSTGISDVQVPEMHVPAEPSGRPISTQSFTGIKGLQAGSVKLLLRALQSEKPGGKLLLYSDEPMDWITENPEYAKQWAFLVGECIRKGVRIEIIHTLSRDTSELEQAVQRWLPFYMTGSIESYYYPEKRDGLFNHTTFLLEGEATLFSSSVRGQNRSSVQYIFASEPYAVESAMQAFKTQLAQCKPLIRTFAGRDTARYIDQQLTFLSIANGSGAAMQDISLAGMSPELLERMLNRMALDRARRTEFAAQHQRRLEAMHTHLQHKDFLMVISLPRITDALKGRVPALVPELLTQQPCAYLPMELHDHLLGIIDLLMRYDHLEFCILPHKHMLHHVQIFAMQNTGMLVLKHRDPKFVFISEQWDLVGAMLGYINQEALRIPKRERNKPFVLEKLREYARRIEEGATTRMLP